MYCVRVLCLFEHFALGLSETEKGCEEIASNSAQQQANFKYEASPERGHHLKHESGWRMRGTTWGGDGGAGWTRWDTALHLTMTLSPLIKTVSQLDNVGNGESAASARVWWRNSLQRLTLLYPGTSLQGSCCHGHCEWKSVKHVGVALQCLQTEHLVFFFF